MKIVIRHKEDDHDEILNKLIYMFGNPIDPRKFDYVSGRYLAQLTNETYLHLWSFRKINYEFIFVYFKEKSDAEFALLTFPNSKLSIFNDE